MGLEFTKIKSKFWTSSLHVAAKKCDIDKFQELICKKKIKNPKDEFRMTPLHFAAAKGHFNICSLIIQQLLTENVEDKNPKVRSF